MRRTFLQYPCGKRFELRFPIIVDNNGKSESIQPFDSNYFKYAKEKFQIRDLKVIELEVPEDDKMLVSNFVSLYKKTKPV